MNSLVTGTYNVLTMTSEKGINSLAYDKGLQLNSQGRAQFYVFDGAEKYITSSSSVVGGSWYHIVGIYNGTSVLLYVNNIYQGSTLVSKTYSFSSPQFVVGGKMIGRPGFNGSIDEVRIYNRSLSADEVKMLYETSLRKFSDDIYYEYNPSTNSNISMKIYGTINEENITDWNVIINTTGLLVGDSYTYSLSAIDLAGNSNSTGMRIVLGNTANEYEFVEVSPSNLDALDPEVEISFLTNVSSTENDFDSIFLQWKNSTSEWNNVSVQNLTPVGYITSFSANFTLPDYEDNITIRFWSNDTNGMVSLSNETILQSFWDCSWNITTSGTGYDLGTVGGFNEERQIGEITIYNTGDSQYSVNNCSINFARTSNGSSWYGGNSYSESSALGFSLIYYLSDFSSLEKGLRYYYENVSITNLTVNASENKTLQIKSFFPLVKEGGVLEENPYFTIASDIPDSIDNKENVTITMELITTPGAYLESSIETPSSDSYAIPLVPGNYSFKTYVKNVVDSSSNPENNTAYNVSLNWSLPSTILSLFSYDDLNYNLII
jgi:hypothetical protein